MTNADLIAYMGDLTSPAETVLSLSTDIWDEPLNDVLEECEVDDAADVTDMKKLRFLARYFAWKRVSDYTTFAYNFSEAGTSYNRSQMHDMAEKAMGDAFVKALPYMSDYQVAIGTVDYNNDPYAWSDTDWVDF